MVSQYMQESAFLVELMWIESICNDEKLITKVFVISQCSHFHLNQLLRLITSFIIRIFW